MPSPEWIADLRRRFPTERTVDRALTRKLKVRAERRPYHPQSTNDVAERIQPFFAKRLHGPFSVSEISPMTGGASKEQFSFRLQWTDSGQARSEKLVLRIQPAESAAETHRLREFQLMNALKCVLPVPQGLWVDAEGEEFGQPSLICSFVPGVTKPPAEGVTGLKMFYGPEYRRLLAPQFIQCLADLANFQWQERDLSAFDAPREGSNEGVVSIINWWERVWEMDVVDPEPIVTLAARWLRDNAPPIDKVSVVHGDYRAGNFLFSPDSGQITAVLDWELAWLGDRHADLAYVLQDLFAEIGPNGERLVCGLCTREEFLDEYQKRSGLPVDPVRLDYYEILMRWRNVVTTSAGGTRCIVGHASHQDILFSWLVGAAAPINLFSLYDVMKTRTFT